MTDNCRPEFDPVPQRVHSERLLIRPTTRADASRLQKWWNDPDVNGPGGSVSGMQYDDSDMEDWFQRYVDGRDCHTHFIIALQDDTPTGDNHPIGELYIANDDRPGCIGLALAIGEIAHHDGGYDSEALAAYARALFDDDLCEAIRVDISVKNQAAVRMCQEVGFEVEHVWANGMFQTMIPTADADAFAVNT